MSKSVIKPKSLEKRDRSLAEAAWNHQETMEQCCATLHHTLHSCIKGILHPKISLLSSFGFIPSYWSFGLPLHWWKPKRIIETIL